MFPITLLGTENKIINEELKIGLNESKFKMKLSNNPNIGDILTNNVKTGQQILIVESIGNDYYELVICDNNPKSFLDLRNFKKGTELFKINNIIVEEQITTFNSIESNKGNYIILK